MSEFDPAKYKLTPERNKEIFENEIVPELLAGRLRQTHPIARFLIGQPGAGKSRMQKEVDAPLIEQGGYIDLDTDLYKPYHDDYDELMQHDDKLMAAATRADGREWMRLAADYARRHMNHVIVQDTVQNPHVSVSMMESYREADYSPVGEFMALDKVQSDQGIYNRYFKQVCDRGAGRLTVPANASSSYEGIESLAYILDERPELLDRVRMWRRGESVPCYDSADSRWEGVPLAEALISERERPWTPEIIEEFWKTQEKMKAPQKPEVQAKLGPKWQALMADLDERAEQKIADDKAKEAARQARQGMASPGMTSGQRAQEAGRGDSSPRRRNNPGIER